MAYTPLKLTGTSSLTLREYEEIDLVPGLKTESIYCLIDPFNLKICLELDSKTEYLKNSHVSDKHSYPWFSFRFKRA